MPAKVAGLLRKLIAVVFTTIVAPVLVTVIAGNWNDGAPQADRGAQQATGQAQLRPSVILPAPLLAPSKSSAVLYQLHSRPAPQLPEIAQVIVHGTGLTPQDALQNAFRTAIQEALAGQLDQDAWARNGPYLVERIFRQREGIILNWKESNTRKEWRLLGTLHHTDVTVGINLSLLMARVRVALTDAPNGYRSPILPGSRDR